MQSNASLTTISLIDDARHVEGALQALRSRTPLVLDMEGVELGRKGHVTMIQLSATPTHVFCFDVQRMGGDVVQRIRPLLEDASITKLCYDARCDADALQHCHGVTLRGVYDLQIAYPLCHQLAADPFLKGLQRALQQPGVVQVCSSLLKSYIPQSHHCPSLQPIFCSSSALRASDLRNRSPQLPLRKQT